MAAAADPAETPAVPASAPETEASPAAVEGKKPEKKPRKRAGTVTKGKDGKEPAKPAGDGKTARPEFDPGHWAEKWDIWKVNEKGGGYYMKDPYQGEWMSLTETHLERWLQSYGLAKGNQNDPIRDVERLLLWIQAKRKLDMVMNLAGHRAGVVKIDTMRILVPKGPELLDPVQGDCTVLKQMLDGLFNLPLEGPEMPHHFQVFVKGAALDRDRTLAIWRSLVREEEHVEEEGSPAVKRWVLDQTPLVYSWLKLALEVLYRRMAGENVARNGHALVIASKPDGGKTLLIGLLKRLLGGRMADVEQFLTGKTAFNTDATSAELLRLSDAPLSTKMEDRLLLGEFIKHVVAESEHRVHAKRENASYTLPLVQRLVWAHNDDPDNLRQVPPMKPELRDKVLWVRANAVRMPMETVTLEDYMKFGDTLKSQLPALAHWLLHEYEVPEPLLGGRFGMLGVQEPTLIREMFEDSPSGELLELVDQARWEVNGERLNLWAFVKSRTEVKYGEVDKLGLVWTGSSHELKALLTEEECSVSGDVRGMLKTVRIDRLLSRLKKEEPNRVEQHRTKTARLWRVARPPQ